MTYIGHVRSGAIILDDPVALEEGAEVHVMVVPSAARPLDEQLRNTYLPPLPEPPAQPRSLAERMAGLIGIVEGPEDWSENHDKYLREEYER